MRVIARVFRGGIGKEVEIDAVQFGFVPGRGAADAVRVLKKPAPQYYANFGFSSVQHSDSHVKRQIPAMW